MMYIFEIIKKATNFHKTAWEEYNFKSLANQQAVETLQSLKGLLKGDLATYIFDPRMGIIAEYNKAIQNKKGFASVGGLINSVKEDLNTVNYADMKNEMHSQIVNSFNEMLKTLRQLNGAPLPGDDESSFEEQEDNEEKSNVAGNFEIENATPGLSGLKNFINFLIEKSSSKRVDPEIFDEIEELKLVAQLFLKAIQQKGGYNYVYRTISNAQSTWAEDPDSNDEHEELDNILNEMGSELTKMAGGSKNINKKDSDAEIRAFNLIKNELKSKESQELINVDSPYQDSGDEIKQMFDEQGKFDQSGNTRGEGGNKGYQVETRGVPTSDDDESPDDSDDGDSGKKKYFKPLSRKDLLNEKQKYENMFNGGYIRTNAQKLAYKRLMEVLNELLSDNGLKDLNDKIKDIRNTYEPDYVDEEIEKLRPQIDRLNYLIRERLNAKSRLLLSKFNQQLDNDEWQLQDESLSERQRMILDQRMKINQNSLNRTLTNISAEQKERKRLIKFLKKISNKDMENPEIKKTIQNLLLKIDEAAKQKTEIQKFPLNFLKEKKEEISHDMQHERADLKRKFETEIKKLIKSPKVSEEIKAQLANLQEEVSILAKIASDIASSDRSLPIEYQQWAMKPWDQLSEDEKTRFSSMQKDQNEKIKNLRREKYQKINEFRRRISAISNFVREQGAITNIAITYFMSLRSNKFFMRYINGLQELIKKKIDEPTTKLQLSDVNDIDLLIQLGNKLCEFYGEASQNSLVKKYKAQYKIRNEGLKVPPESLIDEKIQPLTRYENVIREITDCNKYLESIKDKALEEMSDILPQTDEGDTDE